MIWTKGVHQSAKVQTSDCSCEIFSILYFDRLLLLKAYEISAEKVQKSYVLLKSDAKLDEELICFKNEKNMVNFD